MRRLCAVALAFLFALGTASACTQAGPASPTPTSPSGVTAGQLASQGQAAFTSNCMKCHGDQGQGLTGPPVIGSGARLSKYGTAQGLLDYVSAAMPADAPGSLSSQQYLQVLSLILVRNNIVSSGAVMENNRLDAIQIK